MPLHTNSHGLRSKRTKKDGRKRALSTASSSATNAQTGLEKHSKKQPNGSEHLLNAQAASECSPEEPAKTAPNVFEFLDENEGSSSGSSESEDENGSTVPMQAAPEIQSPKPRTSSAPHALLALKPNNSQKPSKASTTNGASRRPSSSQPAPTSSALAAAETQLQLARKQSQGQDGSSRGNSPSPAKRQLQLSRTENHYTSRDSNAIHRPPLPPSPPSSPEDSLHRITTRRDSSTSHISSGYGLIASHLTRSATQDKASFPPIYRRFESLNHRVLLHLQDEISQMEEELQSLDEYEEMHRVASAEKDGTKPMPASRRVEVQSQAYSSLHYRRMELMAALVQKTERYNNALSAYSKVLQTLPRASEDDIQNYRTWMKEHNPIAAAETRFLDQNTDLVSLTPRLAASAAAAPVYMAIIIASGALLMPLLAFSMISEFSGRLVVVTVVGGAAAAIAAHYSAGIDTLVDSRDGWRCATIYFGFMAAAAMFIP